MDPYTLAYLAGHSDFATTKRYVHPDKHTVLTAMNRATKHKAEAETTYSFRNSVKITKT